MGNKGACLVADCWPNGHYKRVGDIISEPHKQEFTTQDRHLAM